MDNDKKVNFDLKDYPEIYENMLKSSKLRVDHDNKLSFYHEQQQEYQDKLIALYTTNILVNFVILSGMLLIFWLKL